MLGFWRRDGGLKLKGGGLSRRDEAIGVESLVRYLVHGGGCDGDCGR